tara:strand:- start:136 stop:444 length:309 start_codon:yes stop_codon:yes gene_type:complete
LISTSFCLVYSSFTTTKPDDYSSFGSSFFGDSTFGASTFGATGTGSGSAAVSSIISCAGAMNGIRSESSESSFGAWAFLDGASSFMIGSSSFFSSTTGAAST